ncbi:Asparagine synthase, partial [Pseudoloma neurophilia]
KKLTIDNKQTFDHVKISNTIIFLLVQSANQKTIDLLRNDKIIFAFSGGIDSFSSVIILNDIFNEKVEFVLINTFFSKQSPDCIQAKLNYRDLKAKMRRKITFVENFVSSRQINQNISLIKKLVRSNNIMDINIGIVHFFTSKVASQYGKVIFTGNGADELFLGYSKYFDHQENGPTTFNYNYFVEKLINIQKDNVFRDDSIFSRNQVEMRSIFLDNVLFLYFFTLLNDLQNILGFEIEDDEITTRDIHLVAKIAMAEVLSDGIENKKTLRKFLTAKGYPNQAHIKKKAMQFGTGLKTIEKEIFYGSLK